MTLLVTRNIFPPCPSVQIHPFSLVVSRAAELELQLQPQGGTIAPQILEGATSILWLAEKQEGEMPVSQNQEIRIR